MVAIIDESGRAYHRASPHNVQKSAPLVGDDFGRAYDMYRLGLMGNSLGKQKWNMFAADNPSEAQKVIQWHNDFLDTARERTEGVYKAIGRSNAASNPIYHHDPNFREPYDQPGKAMAFDRVSMLNDDLHSFDPATREAAYSALKKLKAVA